MLLVYTLITLSKVFELTAMTDSIDIGLENCKKCGQSLVPLKTIHVERLCGDCGQNFYIVELDDKGENIVNKGGRLILPPGTITLSLNSDQANGRFTRPGLAWYAETLFLQGQVTTPEEMSLTLDKYEAYALQIWYKSPLIEGLDINSEDGWLKFSNNIKERSSEWWAGVLLQGINDLREKLQNNEIQAAAWVMNNLTSYHSMLIFKEFLEPTIWSGYMINNLKNILKIWEQNKENSCENFWQKLFIENSIILSQVFSYPIILLQGSAYTGGKKMDNTGGTLVDFLLINNLSQNTALVEIKTPKTKLLGSLYRGGIYNTSPEINGAVLQISNYKDFFTKDYYRLKSESGKEFYAFNPQCVVIAGTLETEIIEPPQKKSFELFRNGLKDIQLITYDELFGKIQILIELLEG
jgi:hypothetical protein